MLPRRVSIPKRVLEALKRAMRSASKLPIFVSIPERVLEALKLGAIIWASTDDGDVSIPERVLEALKRRNRN